MHYQGLTDRKGGIFSDLITPRNPTAMQRRSLALNRGR
jgi:hypothetical protein